MGQLGWQRSAGVEALESRQQLTYCSASLTLPCLSQVLFEMQGELQYKGESRGSDASNALVDLSLVS